jgi:ATP-dependent Clp protease ATP-binding subunit ClpA
VLTRANGRKASFKDAIIIATSNAGSREIVSDTSITKKYLMESIIKTGVFTPEFLNRFGSVILFLPLAQKDVRKVTKLLVNEFIERIKEDKGIELEVTDETLEKISSVGFDPQFGARPIRRAIEEIIENKVAEYIIIGDTKGKLVI